MVRRKQTLTPEHADVLRKWKERGLLALDFVYEELTPHYMEQLNKVAKNLSGSIYEEHHKGQKVRIYRETTVMTNEEQTMTSNVYSCNQDRTNILKKLGNICCRHIQVKQLWQRRK